MKLGTPFLWDLNCAADYGNSDELWIQDAPIRSEMLGWEARGLQPVLQQSPVASDWKLIIVN